ncbi:hypothetical protein IVB30_05090 [Bradyrhizobium sp. 200]|uniref:hypothetical protein n=1 Tax=Bradyrhizobium sp. 200 TaxID=2782665 RepID=UPI001FFED238|nr:hypothetical protein [Bradyrhizobium sp. 200]UPJ50779.1 hypothetical protein IVB30_05090 [Bradyrhizobium sp. 200]
MSKLKNVYAAATAKFGADLPLALARSFGAVFSVDDVPPERRDGLTAALNRIMNAGGHISMAMAKAAAHGDAKPRGATGEQDEVFRAIRAEAYGADENDEDRKPVAKLDPVSIYTNWNRAKTKREKE